MVSTGAASTHHTIPLESSCLGVCVHSWSGLVMYAEVIQAYQSSREAILLSGQPRACEMQPVTGMVTARFICQTGTWLVMFFSSRMGPRLSGNAAQNLQPAAKGICLLSVKWHPDLEVHQSLSSRPSKAVPTPGIRSCNRVLWAIRDKRTSTLQNCCWRKAGLTLFYYILDDWYGLLRFTFWYQTKPLPICDCE